MKKVVNSKQVLHLFANASQDEAKNDRSSLWFTRQQIGEDHYLVLYSYRTAIAFQQHNGSGPAWVADGVGVARHVPILITSGKYSVTTSKQITMLERAANHRETITVPAVGNAGEGFAAQWIKSIMEPDTFRADLMRDFERRQASIPRDKTGGNSASYLKTLAGYWTRDFARLHNEVLTFPLAPEIIELARVWDEKMVVRENARRERQDAKTESDRLRVQAEIAEKLPAWRSGEINRLPYWPGASFLRLKKGQPLDAMIVETSNGAEVPLDLAVAFYKRLLVGEARYGQHVGAFKFEGEHNGVITIGCHTIRREEMDNLYASLPVEA